MSGIELAVRVYQQKSDWQVKYPRDHTGSEPMRLLFSMAGLVFVAACTDSSLAPIDVPAAPAASVVAAGPHQVVDPATLMPPLDPEFFTCFTQGPGIVCDGVEPFAYADWSPGPDYACGDHLILLTGFFLETGRAWNDAAGRRLKVKSYGRFDETWRLEGSDGLGLEVHGRWNEDRLYGTPGDVSTRTITITGNEIWATAPGRGVVFQNSGLTRIDPNFDVVGQAGPHDFYTNFEGAIADACEILKGV